MATITIPQLNTVTVPTGNDLIEVVQPDSGSASGYATGKESLSQVANLIANGTQFSGLTTTDQTLVGSINEVKEVSSNNLAEAYDETTTYNEGDYCTYNGVLYKCNTDNTTGTWDAQYWDAVKITDVLGGNGLHTYSTTEHIVGTWIDGSPVYERTFTWLNQSYIASGNNPVFATSGLTNVDIVISMTGAIYEQGASWYYLPNANSSASTGIFLINNATDFQLRGSDSWSNADLYITMQYTKSV